MLFPRPLSPKLLHQQPHATMQYVFLGPVSVVPSTNHKHRHNNTTEIFIAKGEIVDTTFEIFVGKGSSQRLFTLYEGITTERSKLLRVARQQSQYWYQVNKAKMLVDEDAQIFSAWLHTVYYGMASLKARMASNGNNDAETARFLTDLYLMAEKLRDPTAANMVIDELINVVDLKEELLPAVALQVYTSANRDDPLRRFINDNYVSNADRFWAENAAEASGLPTVADKDTREVIDEMARLQLHTLGEFVGKLQRVPRTDRQKSLYHMETDQWE
jgi:hypothetical protein